MGSTSQYVIAAENITIGIQAGTDRTVYARWFFKDNNSPRHVASFSYQWDYYVTANKTWFSGGSTGTTDYIRHSTQKSGYLESSCTYSAPENAAMVRFKVKAIAATHKVQVKDEKTGKTKEVDTKWFVEKYSSYKTWTIPTSQTGPSLELSIGGISIKPEKGADRTVIATWKKDEKYDKYVASYSYQWQARIGKVWLDKGSNGTSLSNVRNCEFSYPENASAIRIRVKPAPKQHAVSGQQVDYFTGKWSSWVSYTIPAEEAEATPTVTDTLTPKVSISILNAAQRRLAATWSANDPENHIDSWSYEWYYYDEATNIRLPGGSGSSVSDSFSVSFSPEETAKSIEFRVKAVPKQHEVSGQQIDYFIAYWGVVDFNMSALDYTNKLVEKYAVPYISIWDSSTRRVLGSWTYIDENETIESFEYEWRYYEMLAGEMVLVAGTNGSVAADSDITSVFYTPPEEAYSVEFRIRPVSKETEDRWGESTMFFDGRWTTVSIVLPGLPQAPTIVYKVSNLQLGLQNEDSLNVMAVWGMYDPDDFVDSFAFEFRDYVNGQWLDGQSGNTQTAETTATTYSPAEGATRVEVRVKPNPKSFNAGSQTFDRFVGEFTNWVIFSLPSIPESPSETLTVTNVNIDMLVEDSTTAYATWSVLNPYDRVDSFSYEWRYYSRSGLWFPGQTGTSTVEDSVATYSYPEGAIKIQIRVKPEPKSHMVYGQEIDYFTGVWSDYVEYVLPEMQIPDVPSTPSVSVSGYNLVATVETYDRKTDEIEFEVVVDNKSVYATGTSKVEMALASYQFGITAGKMYKVRAKAKNDFYDSEWSSYSENVSTVPAAPTDMRCNALSSTSVEVTWTASANAATHQIEYATKKRYFDASPDQVQSIDIEIGTRAEVVGLDSGEEYFFRVRAENSYGYSDWSTIVSTVIGKLPDAPTTWSSTSTASIGKNVILYWIHNAPDESRERSAELELDVNGVVTTHVIANPKVNDEDDSGRYSYVLSTNQYTSGAVIKWRVRTQGIVDGYGEWSVQRLIEVYAPPYLNMELGTANNWHWDPFNFQNGYIYTTEGDTNPLRNDTLEYFPLFIRLESGPQSQTPVNYHISILSNETYTDTDDLGGEILIVKDQEIFERYYDTDEYIIVAMITANDVNLSNGVTYTIKAMVSMDSGLTAEATADFTVSWEEEDFTLDAEIGVDIENVTAFIKPYCLDADGGEIEEPIELAVYRREFDGSFVEVGSNISNVLRPTLTDPHPSLNYARYRIVGKSHKTGRVIFNDLPGYPILETSIIIQWNEEWSNFNPVDGEILAEMPWSGSLLRLPANIDLSEKNDMDVEFAEYIGRKHPVSYYGTQVGQSMTLNTDIPADDNDAIYALRRLMVWPGDVYIREPNGNGYWANIKISFNRDHCEVVIPVSIEAKRVEGGL